MGGRGGQAERRANSKTVTLEGKIEMFEKHRKCDQDRVSKERVIGNEDEGGGWIEAK